MDAPENHILRVLREVIAPMLAVEGGTLRVVTLAPERLEVHLSGRLAGAPGAGLFCRRVLEPAIHAVAPGIRVVVTTGHTVPPGAADL